MCAFVCVFLFVLKYKMCWKFMKLLLSLFFLSLVFVDELRALLFTSGSDK